MNIVHWLLNSDPAIRWQVLRDLEKYPPSVVSSERARVAHEGLGAEILALQHPDGTWRREGEPVWRSTLFTLLLLRSTGIDPSHPAVNAAMTRLETGVRWNDLDGYWELRLPQTGGNRFFDGEEEPCINGGALAIGSYFGRPSESLAQRLINEQLEDGGWNCEAPKSRCSSFHSTICVLEGLLEYERATRPSKDIAAVRKRAKEYLLNRRLFRRLTTGEVASPEFQQFAFPPEYRYDVLRALDYFRAADYPLDDRMSEALNCLERRRQPDGRWLLDRCYIGSLPLATLETAGAPSRWNTLRALRVLTHFR